MKRPLSRKQLDPGSTPKQRGRGQQRELDPTLPAEAERRARERLYPGLTSAGYLELRRHRILIEAFFSRIGRVGTILDVGSQYSPYTPIFSGKCDRHLSMDAVGTPLVDIVCNAEQMTLKDESGTSCSARRCSSTPIARKRSSTSAAGSSGRVGP